MLPNNWSAVILFGCDSNNSLKHFWAVSDRSCCSFLMCFIISCFSFCIVLIRACMFSSVFGCISSSVVCIPRFRLMISSFVLVMLFSPDKYLGGGYGTKY